MDDPHSLLRRAIQARGTALLTPLQVHEIEEVSRLAEISRSTGSGNDLTALKHQCRRIKKHWTAISKTIYERGRVSGCLCALSNSFVNILLSTYWNRDGSPLSWIPLRDYIKCLGTPEQREEGAKAVSGGDLAKLDQFYQEAVVLAMTEFMVDRQHIEDHFRAALRGEKLLHPTLHSDRIREIAEKDRATLRQMGPLFEYDKRDKPLSRQFEKEFHEQSEERMDGPSSAAGAYSLATFWNLLGFGDSSNGQPDDVPWIGNQLGLGGGIYEKAPSKPECL